jgi:hypothetical protein
MNIIKLTKKDFKDSKYIGKIDFNSIQECHLEIEGNLGRLYFEKNIIVRGYIYVYTGSGIEAGLGIEAGSGIKAG